MMVQSPHARVLAVDDEPSVLESYRVVLEHQYEVVTASDAAVALALLADLWFPVVLLDLGLPDMDGIDLIRRIKAMRQDPVIIVVTGLNDVSTAVQAVKAGADEYLVKPFEVATLKELVWRACERAARAPEAQVPASTLEEDRSFVDIVSQDAQMWRIFELIARVARNDVTVLLTGESGTGKELLARAIHRRSPRARRRFVAVNCAAIPDALLESELFGHERGAFTGAVDRRVGRFELAEGGTLFLDEIGGMRLDMQAKLLRVLQEREIERVGGERTIPVDVRVIAATNADLQALVAARTFREDLYYRLKVIPIMVPPLRARQGDIPLLADYFLRKYRGRFLGRVDRFSPEALAALQRYDWPGNVRELEHLVQYLLASVPVSHTVIHLDDLPDHVHAPRPLLDHSRAVDTPLRAAVRRFEQDYIQWALKHTQGNHAAAARLLRVHRNTVFRKLAERELPC